MHGFNLCVMPSSLNTLNPTLRRFALRNQLIDQWGINDFSDLKFKYMVDQGIITGPKLDDNVEKDMLYTPGYLAPWKFKHWFNDKNVEQDKLKLPFASANYGAKPKKGTQWSMPNASAPISESRDSLEYATALFRTRGAAGVNIGRPGYGPLPPPGAAAPAAAAGAGGTIT